MLRPVMVYVLVLACRGPPAFRIAAHSIAGVLKVSKVNSSAGILSSYTFSISARSPRAEYELSPLSRRFRSGASDCVAVSPNRYERTSCSNAGSHRADELPMIFPFVYLSGISEARAVDGRCRTKEPRIATSPQSK